MDSFTSPSQFIYNPNSNQESEEEDAVSGTLQIHVHHARNIHNICIYEKQDVYAKFSLTYNPDETLSTRTVRGGGKNPQFNEHLIMKINTVDAVLKCEIWMMSRVKNYMDDQLLGFALVPISSLIGKEKVTQDYDLSSTDLFHSPAGTIKLSLSLNAKKNPVNLSLSFADVDSSATSELLFDNDKESSEEYCSRVEFPDINVARENQEMVSKFFAENGGTLLRPWLEKPDGSFLSLGAAPVGPTTEDCEMDSSPDGSVQNSGFMSSTITSMSDDRNSADSSEKKSSIFTDFSNGSNSIVVETPTFSKEENEADLSEGNKIRDDESVMQKQIVDMYMRSMQQFTESLAKMKLPMDLDKPTRSCDDDEEAIQNDDKKMEIEKKSKDNSRVFYGSRAFF
ncbi:hypothetical protein ABFS83_04G064100 [Erythranthe nasuta]